MHLCKRDTKKRNLALPNAAVSGNRLFVGGQIKADGKLDNFGTEWEFSNIIIETNNELLTETP